MIFPGINNAIALGSPVNWQSPINYGLVGWWWTIPQFMGGLVWRDLTARHNAPRLGTLATWSPAYNHRGGQASLNFGGASYCSAGDYTAGGDPFAIGANDFSVCCWVRPTSVSTYQIAIGRDDDATHRDLILGFGSTSGCILYMTGRSVPGGASPKQSGNVMSSGVWQHIGAQRIGTALTLWFNGTNVYTGTDTETGVVNQATSLGRRNFSGFPQYYTGRMNDVRYHKGAGCPTVKAIYEQSILGYPNALNYVDRLAMYVGSTSTNNRRRRLLLSGRR
jgi:Concanavalin A-like lectin/glucanases superfamily